MRVTDAQLEIVLPVLMRAQRDQGPWAPLEDLLELMLAAARRRRMDELLIRLARDAETAPPGAVSDRSGLAGV